MICDLTCRELAGRYLYHCKVCDKTTSLGKFIDPAILNRGCLEGDHGLGDTTEKILRSMGITKERYVEIKQLFGLQPICNCDARREWLNKVGEYFKGRK